MGYTNNRPTVFEWNAQHTREPIVYVKFLRQTTPSYSLHFEASSSQCHQQALYFVYSGQTAGLMTDEDGDAPLCCPL